MAYASDTCRSPAPDIDKRLQQQTSLRSLLAAAHEAYASYPQTTSRDDLWRALRLLDEHTARLVEDGQVSPVIRDGRQLQYIPAAAASTAAVLEAWLLGGCIAYVCSWFLFCVLSE